MIKTKDIIWNDEEYTEKNSTNFTILNSIERLNLNLKKKLTIQIVGCSKKETGENEKETINNFSNLFKNLKDIKIEIHLIGPDINQYFYNMEYKMNELITLKYYNKFYHEIKDDDDDSKSIDLIILPHAGIWLYPSWLETLKEFKNKFKYLNCPIVITSFAKSDSIWDQNILESLSFSFEWKSEENKFKSLKKRKIETN